MKHLLSKLINFSALKIETPKQRLKKIANCFASPIKLRNSSEPPKIDKPKIDWADHEKFAVAAADTAFEKTKQMVTPNQQLDATQQLRFDINQHIVAIANDMLSWKPTGPGGQDKRKQKIIALQRLELVLLDKNRYAQIAKSNLTFNQYFASEFPHVFASLSGDTRALFERAESLLSTGPPDMMDTPSTHPSHAGK